MAKGQMRGNKEKKKPKAEWNKKKKSGPSSLAVRFGTGANPARTEPIRQEELTARPA